jgi:hypothetical protein
MPYEPEVMTEPIPWFITADVALFVVHESVVLPLYPTELGEAVIEHVGTGIWVTVTVFEQVAVPPAPLTVMMYVVVVLGVTAYEPLSATVPIAVIEAAVALLVVHESTEVFPT